MCTCPFWLLPTCCESFFLSFFTCVFRETDAERRLLDLLCKQILLVEEEDDRSVDEELVVADRVEQHQRLMHAILRGSRWGRDVGLEEHRGRKGEVAGLEQIKGNR